MHFFIVNFIFILYFFSSGEHISVWEDVQPALAHNKVDNLLFKFAESEAVKNRVFDGNNYSFFVVTRAVQVIIFNSFSLILN